jgi:hypothetical protein
MHPDKIAQNLDLAPLRCQIRLGLANRHRQKHETWPTPRLRPEDYPNKAFGHRDRFPTCTAGFAMCAASKVASRQPWRLPVSSRQFLDQQKGIF